MARSKEEIEKSKKEAEEKGARPTSTYDYSKNMPTRPTDMPSMPTSMPTSMPDMPELSSEVVMIIVAVIKVIIVTPTPPKAKSLLIFLLF